MIWPAVSKQRTPFLPYYSRPLPPSHLRLGTRAKAKFSFADGNGSDVLAGMNRNVAKEQKAEIVGSPRRFAAEELDAEWSEVRAGFVLEYFLKEIGPLLNNLGVEDAQKFLRRAVEDLSGTCFEEPMRYWERESDSRGVRRKAEK